MGPELLDASRQDDAHTAQRLTDELIVWFGSTRPDGRPHQVPVWFWWQDPELVVFSMVGTQKLRNIEHGASVALHLETAVGGADVVLAELQVRTEASRDLVAAVAGGELDLAIVALPSAVLPPGLTHLPIVDDPLVAMMSRPAARGSGKTMALSELVERGAFIHYLPGSGLRHSVEAGFERAGLRVHAAFELDQISDMIRVAGVGVGVSIVPRTSTQAIAGEARHTIEFATVALADRLMVHAVGVVCDSHRLAPTAAAFLDAVPGSTDRD